MTCFVQRVLVRAAVDLDAPLRRHRRQNAAVSADDAAPRFEYAFNVASI